MTYTDDQKSAVMAALLAGQSISQVAAEYKMPEATIKTWKRRKVCGFSKASEISEIETPKKQEIGDLLISYLRTNLTTLQKQSEVFQDADWLKKQSASELAVLHGVIADKTIRLLEALADKEEL